MRLGTIRADARGPWLPAAFFGDCAVDLRLTAEQRGTVPVWLRDAPRESQWLLPEHREPLKQLIAAALESEAASALADVQIGPPVPHPGKIIACGRNYMDHLREGQRLWAARGKTIERPIIPSAFIKLSSALTHHNATVLVPADISDVDYEVELAVVIGNPAYRVTAAEALHHVAGYTICNDLATRPIQMAEMEQQIGIVMGKNLPGFAPLGPWLVTDDELPDPQSLAIGLKVNGDVRQDAHTRDMIFAVSELVEYWSRLGLQTGDILLTGTPAGVAVGHPPEERQKFYLKSGDCVEAWIAGIGTLRSTMAWS
jgi:2-keto-4-pentenoate hydratase/2-oxohepta-3-ene-1,7-dioic acid hydratase in catechol pathway